MSDLRARLTGSIQHLIGSSLDARKGSLAKQIVDAILNDPHIAVVELPEPQHVSGALVERDEWIGLTVPDVTLYGDGEIAVDDHIGAVTPTEACALAAALLAAARKAEETA